MKFQNVNIFIIFKISMIFGSGGSQQARVAGSTTGMHAPPRGWPGGPRVAIQTTGWPATLPGIRGGSPEAGGTIGAVQGTSRGVSKKNLSASKKNLTKSYDLR